MFPTKDPTLIALVACIVSVKMEGAIIGCEPWSL